jgi:hypothetical protein
MIMTTQTPATLLRSRTIDGRDSTTACGAWSLKSQRPEGMERRHMRSNPIRPTMRHVYVRSRLQLLASLLLIVVACVCAPIAIDGLMAQCGIIGRQLHLMHAQMHSHLFATSALERASTTEEDHAIDAVRYEYEVLEARWRLECGGGGGSYGLYSCWNAGCDCVNKTIIVSCSCNYAICSGRNYNGGACLCASSCTYGAYGQTTEHTSASHGASARRRAYKRCDSLRRRLILHAAHLSSSSLLILSRRFRELYKWMRPSDEESHSVLQLVEWCPHRTQQLYGFMSRHIDRMLNESDEQHTQQLQ